MAGGGLVPSIIFLDEVQEGVSDGGIVGDELMIEVGKAEEGLYIFYFGRGWPGSDAVELYGIHGELTGFHDHSKIFDSRDVKLAFFEL